MEKIHKTKQQIKTGTTWAFKGPISPISAKSNRTFIAFHLRERNIKSYCHCKKSKINTTLLNIDLRRQVSVMAGVSVPPLESITSAKVFDLNKGNQIVKKKT